MKTPSLALLMAALALDVTLAGCSDPDPVVTPPDDVADDLGCPAIFAQNLLPDYNVTISAPELAKLEAEFKGRVAAELAMIDPNPYHPIEFRYRDVMLGNAMIRLKGQSSWLQTVMLDPNPKMQFVISFNEVDPKGRFFGVRKIELDMPRSDASFLQQRLALYQFRKAGIDAQCANHARLTINGTYYGVFTNLERMDKEFLQRRFGELDEGDLWEGGRIIQTNEDTFSWARLDQFWHLGNLAQLVPMVDFMASVRMWSVDAMMGDADGYYNGRANFYLYDHPTRGFLWLPHDLDTAFNESFLPAAASPLYPAGEGRNKHDREHWALIMEDAEWQDRYVTMLAEARAHFDVKALQARIDAWSAQIATSVAQDTHSVATHEEHLAGVVALRGFVAERAAAVDSWLSCRGGGGADLDGDGFTSCYDCAGSDPAAYPGATERCNGQDDDCDARSDEGLTCP